MAAIKVILSTRSERPQVYFLENSEWFRKILIDKGNGCL